MFLGHLIPGLPGEWIQSDRKGLAEGFLGQGAHSGKFIRRRRSWKRGWENLTGLIWVSTRREAIYSRTKVTFMRTRYSVILPRSTWAVWSRICSPVIPQGFGRTLESFLRGSLPTGSRRGNNRSDTGNGHSSGNSRMLLFWSEVYQEGDRCSTPSRARAGGGVETGGAIAYAVNATGSYRTLRSSSCSSKLRGPYILPD